MIKNLMGMFNVESSINNNYSSFLKKGVIYSQGFIQEIADLGNPIGKIFEKVELLEFAKIPFSPYVLARFFTSWALVKKLFPKHLPYRGVCRIFVSKLHKILILYNIIKHVILYSKTVKQEIKSIPKIYFNQRNMY